MTKQSVKKWYEVYEYDSVDTRTIATFDTLKEAQKFRNTFNKEYGLRLHIDYWKDIYNPTQVKYIE